MKGGSKICLQKPPETHIQDQRVAGLYNRDSATAHLEKFTNIYTLH